MSLRPACVAANPREEDNPAGPGEEAAGGGRRPGGSLGGAGLEGPNDANASVPVFAARRENGAVADVLDLAAELLYARWRRAVDLLWREALFRRRRGLAERERIRSARRMKNFQKIVRKALSDYHRLELERQRRGEPRPGTGQR
jgi:hypothetical protein